MPADAGGRNGHGAARTRGTARPGEQDDGPDLFERLGEFARGRRCLELQTDLALGEWSHAELSAATGLDMRTLAEFADAFGAEIGEIARALKGELARETAGLWISQKQMRLAELQGMYEDIDDLHARLNSPRPTWSRSHRDVVKAKLDILRQAAEELGAFPQRQQQPARTGSTVHYVIEADEADLGAMT